MELSGKVKITIDIGVNSNDTIKIQFVNINEKRRKNEKYFINFICFDCINIMQFK